MLFDLKIRITRDYAKMRERINYSPQIFHLNNLSKIVTIGWSFLYVYQNGFFVRSLIGDKLWF